MAEVPIGPETNCNVPPCCSIIVLEMFSPNPVPNFLVVKKEQVTLSSMSFGIPGPVSDTEMTRLSGAELASLDMRKMRFLEGNVVSSIASRLFFARLIKTCFNWSGSAKILAGQSSSFVIVMPLRKHWH